MPTLNDVRGFFRRPQNYAEQTYGSPNFIVRYAHQRRYIIVRDFIETLRPPSLLDYGAGDGHVLLDLLDRGHLPTRTVAYEPVDLMADALIQNVLLAEGQNQIQVSTTLREVSTEKFDFIICLGVLEHLPLLEREKFYRVCKDQLAIGGQCLIDVPVEVGPTLLVKHLGRMYIKGRKSEYSRAELAAIVAGRRVFDPRRFDSSERSTWIQNHKGFDYRLFGQELQHRFRIVDKLASPVGSLPPWLLNQEAYFLIENR